MHQTMDWLASFFPTWGVRAICVAIICAIAQWLLAGIGGSAASLVRPLRWCAIVAFTAFVTMAAFYAFRL